MTQAEVDYSEQAADQLESLETEIARRIMSELEDVVWNPEHYLGGRRLTNSPYYSLRVGDYRAIIDWQHNEDPERLFVREVDHRSNIYD